jgi:hypothetical protein
MELGQVLRRPGDFINQDRSMSVLDPSLEWRAEVTGTVDRSERPDALPLRPKLSFAGAAYEQSFVRYYHGFYYRYAQASLVVGMVLILGDFLVDRLASPTSSQTSIAFNSACRSLQSALPIPLRDLPDDTGNSSWPDSSPRSPAACSGSCW